MSGLTALVKMSLFSFGFAKRQKVDDGKRNQEVENNMNIQVLRTVAAGHRGKGVGGGDCPTKHFQMKHFQMKDFFKDPYPAFLDLLNWSGLFRELQF